MTFDKVLPALRTGKKIRRNDWDPCEYYYYDMVSNSFRDEINKEMVFKNRWLTDNDWEIIDDNGDIISDLSEPDPIDIPSDALSAWHDGYDTGYKVGKNDTLLKIRDYVNEIK